jgi:hypothetical protein
MATMGFRPYPGPDPRKIVYIPENAAEFVTGDLVIITSGYVEVATDDLEVFGIALANHDISGAMVPVYTITPGDRFIAEATATTAETNKGVAYALTMTTGSMGVDTSSTTTPSFYIDELDPRDGPHTGAGGRVIGRFIADACDAIGG